VQTDQREHAEALAALLERSGFAAHWPPERSPPRETAATIVDLAQGSPREWRLLAATCRASRGPVVALLGFPRPEDAARARELGAAALLSKPVDARDLAAVISANATPADS
jgi:DNA-binding response OmpR family regulator